MEDITNIEAENPFAFEVEGAPSHRRARKLQRSTC